MNNINTFGNNGQYHDTLTVRALKYLWELEVGYGPRTNTCLYGGIEFTDQPGTGPRVWYPCNCSIVVRLTMDTATDLTVAIFQLSHEMVHVLCDGGPNRQAKCLEEGFATWFSKMVTDRDSGNPNYAGPAITGKPNYNAAFTLFNQLLLAEPNAIQKLRVVQPILGNVSTADFATAGVNASPALIASLLAPF